MSDDSNLCALCGEPLPEGEQMFNYHGYSGPCPKPPKPSAAPARPTWREDATVELLSAAVQTRLSCEECAGGGRCCDVCLTVLDLVLMAVARAARAKQAERCERRAAEHRAKAGWCAEHGWPGGTDVEQAKAQEAGEIAAAIRAEAEHG